VRGAPLYAAESRIKLARALAINLNRRRAIGPGQHQHRRKLGDRRSGVLRARLKPLALELGCETQAAKERKDRVDDAMHATRAAVEEGIVAGGGVALLYASKVLAKLKPANDDQKVGIDIVRRALQTPARQIAENAGIDGSIVIGKLQDKSDANYGYDAQTGEYVDMLKAGIIDPTKVVRLALQDAASVAGLLVTTEAMVAEKPEPKSAPAMPHGGGMGGMDF
jgi:chaperonin GroEL